MSVPEAMTEDQIERAVERMVDNLDRRFMSIEAMTQAQYDAKMREITQWADYQYRFVRRA